MKVTSNRISILPILVGQQLFRWLDQCAVESKTDGSLSSRLIPRPYDLGALSEYAAALVFYDGIVVPSGPNKGHEKVVPDWAYWGYCYAYDSIENTLSHTPDGFDESIISNLNVAPNNFDLP